MPADGQVSLTHEKNCYRVLMHAPCRAPNLSYQTRTRGRSQKEQPNVVQPERPSAARAG
jgi:hypothetical protein